MVDFQIISQLVEFILCILYDAVVLTVILQCVEATVFHLRTAIAVHVGAEGQIQSLKSVVAYALLIVIVVALIGIALIRCGIRVKPYLSHREKTTLCSKCRRKERVREVQKGLVHSERNWLHRFCRGLFLPSRLKIF